jgi:peptide/nickel transport system substrate-binding protein
MMGMRIGLIGLAMALLGTACAPAPRAPTPPGSQPSGTESGQPKRMTAVIRGAPASLAIQRTSRSGGSVRGLDGIEELAHAGLTYLKADGTRTGQLAEAAPTIENGLWRVFPDGRMETTWKIRPTARWHDGTPLTSQDLLFTATVEQDREVEIPPSPEYELIEELTAPDPLTITASWKRPFIEADAMFSYRGAGLPMPRHLLEQAFTEDKAGFLGHPYWSVEFVGTGAFQMREWVRDMRAVMRANENYVFGRPKIDEIEVRFIPDNNTLLANVLAGADLTLGKTISLDMALQSREQWKGGRLEVMPQNWTPVNAQFITPDPPVVTDLRFRRAMLLALDRQQLADLVFSGHGAVAHSYVGPETPLYHLVEPSIVKYEYEPRRAAQIVDELGYTKRGDGFLYDETGQRLNLSIYAGAQNDIHPKTTAAVAAMWQQLGASVEQVLIPVQRAGDREYRAHFPSFEIAERRNSLIVTEIWRFHSSQVPLPENRYRGSGTRYRHAELDGWLERYVATIPMAERMGMLAGLVHHQTSNLSQLPLFHGADPTLISNRLINVTARGDAFTQAWNAHEWDVRG